MQWNLTAYILVVERRICETCGEIHEAPAYNPRILLTSEDGATRTASFSEIQAVYGDLAKILKRPYTMPTLPRYTHFVATNVSACQHCFHEHLPEQGDMFPSKSLRNYTKALSLISDHKVATGSDTEAIAELVGGGNLRKSKSRRAKPKKSKTVTPLDLSQF